MRNIHVFLRSFNRISELKSETDTTGWEDIAEQLNNTIKAHQSLLADISNAQKMYDDLLYDFFIERNNSISTNPNIKSGLMDIFTATDDESTSVNSNTVSVTTTGTPTAIDQVTAPLSIYATGGRIYGAENARIYTILGMDVTEQNGNLNGIYVVKANGKTQKIAVK